MLPEPKDPEREEVIIEKAKELSVEFVLLDWRFKFSVNFSRD